MKKINKKEKKEKKEIINNVEAITMENNFPKILLVVLAVVVLISAFLSVKGGNVETEEKKSMSEISTWVEATSSDNYVITVIGLSYCSHCENYYPVISELAQENNIELYWYDIDEMETEDAEILRNQYGFYGDHSYDGSSPYTAITKNGEFVSEYVGEMDEEATKEFLVNAGVIE